LAGILEKQSVRIFVAILLSQSFARIFFGWTPSLSIKDRSVYVLVWLLGLCPLEPLHRSCINLGDLSPLSLTFLEVPSISIQHWNYSQGHTNYKDYEEQDKKLGSYFLLCHN
jgi:hypothetical protein